MIRLGLLMIFALTVPWQKPASTLLSSADQAPDRVVFRETRSLLPGEYQATFRLALIGSSQDFREIALSREAAQISVIGVGPDTTFVPPQHLTRRDFPISGFERSFSVFFYVEKETSDIAFEVVQRGDLELRMAGFSLVNPDHPPLRLLLVAGRGADNTGWQAYVSRGSANYGLVDGGQHFLAYMVETLSCGSLTERTRVLAEYINGLHVPDRSLRALGHSMGGLDLRFLVGLANQGQEPYYSAARKLAKVYTAGTPHRGTAWASAGRSFLARPLRGVLCVGEPLLDDVTPEAMAAFNEQYTWERFEIDGWRVPFLAFTFEARCLPWWTRWLARGSDTVVTVVSQGWGNPDAPPPDLPWSAVHAPPLDLGSCIAERSFMDVLNWMLSDPSPTD